MNKRKKFLMLALLTAVFCGGILLNAQENAVESKGAEIKSAPTAAVEEVAKETSDEKKGEKCPELEKEGPAPMDCPPPECLEPNHRPPHGEKCGPGPRPEDDECPDCPRMKAGPNREPPFPRLRMDVSAVMARLEKEDPEEFARLQKLHKEDPKQFFREIREKMPENPGNSEEIFKKDRECMRLAERIRQAKTEEEKKALIAELKKNLEESYNLVLADLQTRMDKMNAHLQYMKDHSEEIQQKRLERFLKASSRPAKKDGKEVQGTKGPKEPKKVKEPKKDNDNKKAKKDKKDKKDKDDKELKESKDHNEFRRHRHHRRHKKDRDEDDDDDFDDDDDYDVAPAPAPSFDFGE